MTVITSWLEAKVPVHLPVTQVYGFCFDEAGRILLIQDEQDRFGLPGGKPEGVEDFDATLRREVMEEAQVTLTDVTYLGYQLVMGDVDLVGGRPYAQVRMIARIDRVLPSAPDPATGCIYRRFVVLPTSIEDLLQWKGDSGKNQITAACQLARETWDSLSTITMAPMVSLT